MIAVWMLYAIAVGLLIGSAAVVAEHGLRLRQGQARWVWVGALGGTLLIPLWRSLPTTVQPLSTLGLPESLAPRLALTITPSPSTMAFDAVLVGAWMVSSGALLLLLLWTQWSVRQQTRGLPATTVRGSRVRIGPWWGPAVTWGGDIVVPQWVVALPPATRDLIVHHEHEHQRAGDVRVLGMATLAVVVMPWNPACWWQLRRLRAAIELDCDRRLLSSGVNRAAYGAMLLDVADRGGRFGLDRGFAVALLARSSMLARRISHMTRLTRHPMRAAAMMAGGLVLAVVACAAPAPWREAPGVTPQVAAAEPALIEMDLVRYPALLRQAGIEGYVVMSLAVLPDGSVDAESVRVISRTNRAFERPAVDAARSARYEAGERAGPVTVQLTVRFQLTPGP